MYHYLIPSALTFVPTAPLFSYYHICPSDSSHQVPQTALHSELQLAARIHSPTSANTCLLFSAFLNHLHPTVTNSNTKSIPFFTSSPSSSSSSSSSSYSSYYSSSTYTKHYPLLSDSLVYEKLTLSRNLRCSLHDSLPHDAVHDDDHNAHDVQPHTHTDALETSKNIKKKKKNNQEDPDYDYIYVIDEYGHKKRKKKKKKKKQIDLGDIIPSSTHNTLPQDNFINDDNDQDIDEDEQDDNLESFSQVVSKVSPSSTTLDALSRRFKEHRDRLIKKHASDLDHDHKPQQNNHTDPDLKEKTQKDLSFQAYQASRSQCENQNNSSLSDSPHTSSNQHAHSSQDLSFQTYQAARDQNNNQINTIEDSFLADQSQQPRQDIAFQPYQVVKAQLDNNDNRINSTLGSPSTTYKQANDITLELQSRNANRDRDDDGDQDHASGGGGEGGGGRGGLGGSGGSENEGDGDNHSDPQHPLPFQPPLPSSLLTEIGAWLQKIPAPFVALISALLTTFCNQRFQIEREKKSESAKREEKVREANASRLVKIRTEFEAYMSPFIKCLAVLQNRLYVLASGDPRRTILVEKKQNSDMYTTYLIATYLGWVAVLKNQSPTMDFGARGTDQIIENIVGRISSVFAGSSRVLNDFSRLIYGETFKKMVPAGPLYISSADQSSIGELMRAKHWDNVVLASGRKLINASSEERVINFVDFKQLIKTNDEFKALLQPLYNDVHDLSSGRSKFKWNGGPKWIRIFALHTSFLDLIDFLDPLPRYKFVPRYRRKRLCTEASNHYPEEVPSMLKNALLDMARFREGDVLYTKDSLQFRDKITVFVKGVDNEPGSEVYSKDATNLQVGSCPFSHAVVFGLEEARLPYYLIKVRPDKKPRWYYNIHPTGKVPIAISNNTVYEDSSVIIEYLVEKRDEPKNKKNHKWAKKDFKFPKLSFNKLSEIHNMYSIHIDLLNWMSCKTPRACKAKQIALKKKMEMINSYLSKHTDEEHPFLGGKNVSVGDIRLIPHLYHTHVLLKHYGQTDIPVEFGSLRDYLSHAYELPSFQKSKSSEKVIRDGYEHLRHDSPDNMNSDCCLSDMQ